jgi:hypothetical protein
MAANKGAKHHAAKMTEAGVKAARKAYDNGSFIMVDGKRHPVTVNALARKYGVSHQTMHALLKRRTWQHVS